MAVNIGELFGSLSWNHDKKGADEFDRRYDEAQAKARKKIEAQLGAAVDERAFAKYHEQLARAERRAKQKEAFKVALGADYDPKGFAAFSRAANQAERDAHKAKASTKSFSDELDGLSVKLPSLSRTMGLLKWPAIIAGAGMAAQAVSAATAGVTALGSALAPLSGALAAYPALGSAAAQGIGVWKLATDDVFKVVGGLNEQMDTQSKAFKKLSPEAQNFAKTLEELKKPLTDLPAVAQKGLLPGLETGIKSASQNLDVVRPLIRDTAKAIGEIATEAGKLVGSRAFGRDLQTQGERNVKWIREGGTGALHLANAVRNVTLAAGPLVDWMVRGAVQGTKLVDTFTAQARQSGKLADFFHQTQVEMSRVVRIGADVATAFFNIARVGKPLGDEILVSIVKAADHFRRWTDSARGQNAIAEYFRQARPAIFELGRLLHDVTIDFLKLGQGNQVAPLIRTIRVDLLPRFVELVDATTKSFGPPMLEAIKQVAILFTHLGGTNGPLTQLVTLVGKIAGGINKAIDVVPGLGSAISSLSTVASLYAALRIASTLSGLSRIIRLIKDARKASVATGAVEVATGAGGAAAGGAAAGAGAGATGAAARGGIAGAIVSKLPIAAIGTAIAVAIAAAIPKTKVHRKFTDFFNFDSTKLDDQLSAVDRFNRALGRLSATGDKKGADRLADQFTHLKNAAHGLGSVRDIDRLTDSANDLAKAGGTLNRDIGRALGQAAKHFADFRRTGSNNLEGIRHATSDNMHFIRRTLGEDSAAGKEALARNFRLARSAIRQAMDDGKISVKDGLAEIQRLMRAELKQYGITGGVASSIIKHGNIKGSDAPAAGHARGGFAGKKAGGGFFGDRGQRGQDTIHALVGEGEAILNHHQQSVVEGLLGPGFLDWLFANVRRPHYAALGGKVRKFAAGGIAGAVAAANQLEAAHFPYRWGGGHQATPAPFGPMDCSGAVSYVLQHAGVNIPTMVSGQLASAGKAGTGAITVFANPTHTFMRIGNRYFGTSGSNPGGGAGWMPDPGAGYKARFAQRGFAGGAGGAGGVLGGFSSITPPILGGSGALGAITQAAVGAVARGANQRADQLIGSMGLGTGDPGDPGPVPKGAVGKARLMDLWRGAGGPSNLANIAAAIALAESGGNPTAHNPSGASGLWQILGQVVPGNIFSPTVNARNAVKKWHDAHGFTPWVQYTTGAYRQFLSRGGRAQRFASGGFANLASRAWGQATGIMGSHGAMPSMVFTGRLGGGHAYAHFNAQNGNIAISSAMLAALRNPRSRDHDYALAALVHEFAHARQRADVIMDHTADGFRRREGGAELFARENAARVMRAIGVPYHSAAGAYPSEVSWLRRHVKPSFWRRDQFAHAGGGIVQRFAAGGRAGSKKLKLPHGLGKATAGLVRHVAPLQTDRSESFDGLMARVESADGEYQRWERRFNITDEELVDSDTGQLNVGAIHRKAKELTQLVMIRAGMERDLKEAREVARRLVASYRRVIRALRKSLRHAKNKDRSGIRSYISTYEKRASEWTGKVGEVGGTLFDTHTDLLQVRGELREVLATKPESRDTGADTGDLGGGDIGLDTGGPDTTAGAAEPAPAPPTALDIAAGVQAALAEYKSQQSDLIRNFGANAVTQRAAVAPGGVLSATPDLEGAALGALRGFGAASSGTLGMGSGGPSVGQLVVNFASPPADGPTLVQQLRFQVENGGVG